MGLFNRDADTPLYYATDNGYIDVLWLLVKANTNVDVLSQYRRIAASSVSVVLGIADVLKYLMELRACTPPTVRVLACIHCLRKN